jgi:hypothetical protein
MTGDQPPGIADVIARLLRKCEFIGGSVGGCRRIYSRADVLRAHPRLSRAQQAGTRPSATTAGPALATCPTPVNIAAAFEFLIRSV